MDELLVAIQNAANTIATPNWADIMSVCFSLAAVIVACFVARKQIDISREQTEISKKQTEISQEQATIADKQNRIALFEKRLEIYDILSSCKISTQILGWLYEDEKILKCLFSLLVKNEKEYQEHRNEARAYLINCSIKLQRATFLFPEEITPYIFNVSNKLYDLVDADFKKDGPKKYNEKKQTYIKAIDDLDKNGVIKRVEAEMKMI